MDGFWSSASKWLNEKTSSPLYFTYIGFFVIWNWRFFQIIFLENETLFYSPRIEYLAGLELHLFSVPFLNSIINLVWHLGPPAFFTFLATKYLPILNKWAFDIYLQNYFTRKNAYREANIEYEQEKTVGLKREAKEKKKQAEQRVIIEKTKSQKEKWDEEFEQFKTHQVFYKFKQVIESLYKYSGHTTRWISSATGDIRVIDIDLLALVHSKELVNIKTDKNNNEIIELTEKGKFFVSKFLENNSI